MKKFRLPRKTKKFAKKGLWLYPADEKGNSLMASPARSQEEYDALKKGTLRNLFEKEKKAERKEYREKMDKEVYVTDAELKTYIDDIIRKDLRISSFRTLLSAKEKPRAKKAYFNFINAYHLYREGEDSYVNVCCLAIDLARDLLRKQRK